MTVTIAIAAANAGSPFGGYRPEGSRESALSSITT
jgi:hypothetical protein